MIISKNNNITFKSVKTYNFEKDGKTKKLITKAANDEFLKPQIDALEKQGIDLDIVKNYDHEARPTNYASVYLSRKPGYFTKDGMNPIQDVNEKITSVKDAKRLIARGIAASIGFMKQHFEYVKEAKKLGID
ncbi:MAG: hypothetical protein WCF95_00440 [bacterium]